MNDVKVKWMPRWASKVVERLGWRLVTVGLIGVLMAIITGVLFWLGIPERSEKFWSEVFAAWVGGVFLFIVSGIAVALVSIVPPETASFEARARILFRAARGAHVDYIIEQLRNRLEQYSRLTRRTVTVRDYDPKEGKFLLQVSVVAHMRSYIDDAPSTALTPFKIENATSSPPGRARASVMVRCNDEALIPATEFDTEYNSEYTVRIEPGHEAKVETIINYWVQQVHEPCTNNPVRFIRLFELVVDNQLRQNVRINLAVQADDARDIIVGSGSTAQLINLAEVTPNQQLFSFHLLEPGT